MRRLEPYILDRECIVCGSAFTIKHSYFRHHQKKGQDVGLFCSRQCMGVDQTVEITKATIENNSEIDPETRCWNWTSTLYYNGYGRLPKKLKGENSDGAHRASYILYKGPIPEGQLVRHTCDNPICVNPEHLIIGSFWDNKNDSVERKRHAYGSKNGRAIIDENTVRSIKKGLSSGLSQSEVARRYNINHLIVCRIDNNITWRHVK